MDADTDYIIRSRTTILTILANRGYNIDTVKDVSPEDIAKLVATDSELLTILAPKREGSTAPMERAVVVYLIESAVRQSVDSKITKLWSQYDSTKDELIILVNEPFHDTFNVNAIRQWAANKSRVSFFPIKSIITNPTDHTFVPPHRKLDAAEIDELMRTLHLKSKNELPHIKFHADMQARVLGLVPGDIVEIKRPSETCGTYTIYRVCAV
jgi:DNA-directed RNA polymerase subunit H (RpoH/RPB5)